MSDVWRSPALWGFLGALMFSTGRITIFLSQERVPGRRALVLEILKFSLAVFFGTVFAVAFTPVFIAHFKSFDTRPAALTIGMLVNTVAPAVVNRVEKLVDTFISLKG